MPFTSMILPRTLSTGHAWLSKRVGRTKNRHRESGASRQVQDQEWPVGEDPRQGGRTAQRAAGRPRPDHPWRVHAAGRHPAAL